MKKIFKAIATFLATVCCLGIFAGCNKPTVVVGYTEYAPMNYTNEKGKFVGFDTELAQKVFKELGYRVRFKEIDWDNKYSELDGGTINCIWNGFTSNCADSDGVERSAKVDFSYNYMTNAQCVIRLNSAEELPNKEALAGKSVAFEGGSAGQSYAEKIAGVNAKNVSSQMDAVFEVKSGTAQYAVVDLLLAQSVVGQGDFANVTINSSIVIDAEYYAIGFKKDSELTALVNQKLEEYAENGYLSQLAEKYGLSTQVITDFSSQK